VGINYLEKIQIPTLPSLFGALIADVDVVLMGAGIPVAIPEVLDRLSAWKPVELALHVANAKPGEPVVQTFDPRSLVPSADRALHRPQFLAIVASDTVARTLQRRAVGRVDGFVVEHHRAGGHNAPPRRATADGGAGDALFGPRDEAKLDVFRRLGAPFWLAGSRASPEGLAHARAAGAQGIQVGTAFAFCDESGMRLDLRRDVLARHAAGTLRVRTDLQASPTGYPFKLIELPGSSADPCVAAARRRVCDLGFLCEAYCDASGNVGFRCPGEPEAAFQAKGGDLSKTPGKQCLCNGLLATVGLGQQRRNGPEPPTLTAGKDFGFLDHVRRADDGSYSARDVIAYLRGSAAAHASPTPVALNS
jgi:nitronate monooxygenase